MKIEDTDALIYNRQGANLAACGEQKVAERHRALVPFYREQLKGFLPSDLQAKMVDVPCGDGNMLHFLQELGYRNAAGWDIEPARVDLAQKNGLNAHCGEAFEIAEKETDCAVIFSLDFVEHLEKNDAMTLLFAFHRALKKDGVLILRTPVTDSIYGGYHLHNDFTHRWAVNSAVWKTIADASGFSVAAIRDERPRGRGIRGGIKRLSFALAKSVTVIHRRMLSNMGVPNVWSPSVWIFLTKKSES